MTRPGGRLTAVVVTHNSAEVLPSCLTSLRREAEAVAALEVVVVDNDSSDGSESVALDHCPDALIVQMGCNAGYAAAVNAGVSKRRGRGPVLVLNPDVQLEDGSVHALLVALSADGVGIVAPRLVDLEGRLQPSLRRRPTVLRALGPALLGRRADAYPALSEVVPVGPAYDEVRETDWATGAALLISEDCLRDVGPWDESYFLYSEETDFCLRARDHGYVVAYEPTATVIHRGGRSGSDPGLWSLLTVNRVRFARRRLGPLRGSAFAAAVAVNEGLRTLAGRPTARAALRALLVPRSRAAVRSALQGNTGAPDRSTTRATPVVCFSGQDFWYHNRAHSDVQLMRRLAESRHVLLVNSIGMLMPVPGRTTQPFRRILRKARSTAHFLRRPDRSLPQFAVLSPVLLPLYGSQRVRDLNARVVAAQVRWACRRLGIEKPTVVVTLPTAIEVLPHLPHGRVVFNHSDKHSEFGEAQQDVIRAMEDELLRRSDAVVYVSSRLMADEAERTGSRAVFLDHGVDLAHFTPRSPTDNTEPGELRNVPRPRVGFFGGLDDYVVDLALLERVAREVPEAELLLIGDATCNIERLTRLPNVTYLSRRPYESIPAYGRAFDVALMPWLDNDWIRACNPIKLKEYLALGLPIVSTDFPEVRRYSDVIRVAENQADFVALVRRTLEDGGPASVAQRRSAVRDASWDAVAQRLAAVCDAAEAV